MGLCSGKAITGSGSSFDILESTAWIREVVVHNQKKRKGVGKFCSFSFSPLGVWKGVEEVHQVTVDFQDTKGAFKSTHLIVRLAAKGGGLEGGRQDGGDKVDLGSGGLIEERGELVQLRGGGELGRELRLRETFLAELSRFQTAHSYKRARYLVNFPETIFLEEKVTEGGRCLRLVTEDVTKTKACKAPNNTFLEGGMDLAHTRIVLATLAQFHATSLAWKLSLQDDSVLDIFPLLSRPPSSHHQGQSKKLIERYERIMKKIAPKKSISRILEKMEVIRRASERLELPCQEEDLCDPLGTVCLGPISPLHLAFQYQLDPDSLPEHTRPGPSIAAVTRVGNLHYSSLPRDLANVVFSLAAPQVRRHYLLCLLQNYLITLTNTLELLGVGWERLDIDFNHFAEMFFQAVEEGLARAVLTAMGDTKVEEVEKFLAEPLSLAVIDQVTKEGWEEGWQVEEEEEMEEENDKVEENNIGGKKEELGRIPLTVPRLRFLLHLLDDVRKFM